MSAIVDLQVACDNTNLPHQTDITKWLNVAINAVHQLSEAASNPPSSYEVTVRIATPEESQQLNSEYRGKDKPTNVLSFPFQAPPGIQINLLGDLIVCADVVEHEAKQQNKPLNAHWAHMIIHGCLHLQGYDHINDEDAEEMEALEVKILADLGIDNPYQINDSV
ncbi:rRNA maturation RNase YbeY [Flocculibacter collagenilyticus]|uniref:rRNA maturation RNase YbeY n=1 Tax=Flocculibacter collagenilyticus TaxID=2744479 RepID=UPI0018F658CB|nr:rRNA maturation RNase YbeY [Flocculibacter collagenilyticus]